MVPGTVRGWDLTTLEWTRVSLAVGRMATPTLWWRELLLRPPTASLGKVVQVKGRTLRDPTRRSNRNGAAISSTEAAPCRRRDTWWQARCKTKSFANQCWRRSPSRTNAGTRVRGRRGPRRRRFQCGGKRRRLSWATTSWWVPSSNRRRRWAATDEDEVASTVVQIRILIVIIVVVGWNYGLRSVVLERRLLLWMIMMMMMIQPPKRAFLVIREME